MTEIIGEKVCAIVGAGTGISMSVARRFAREGYHIALVARSADKLARFVNELRDVDQVAHGFPGDAADAESMAATFQNIHNQMNAPDVLVYNVSRLREGAPSTLDTEALVEDFRVNVVGALHAVRQVLPAMRERKRGTILFTGGGLALNPMAQYSSLAIGKAGLRSLAFSLAQELEPVGIVVGTVTVAGFVKPGTYFDPERIADSFWQLHNRDVTDVEIIYAQAQ